MKKKLKSIVFKTINALLALVLLLLLVFIWKVKISIPNVDENMNPESFTRLEIAKDHYSVGNNWLKKNEAGIWEMYIEGEAYERGVIYGVLAKELIESQEAAFVNQIDELIPSAFFQQVLRVFIAWFNRDMDEYIPNENLKEIYGISKSFSDKYDYIGPKLYRIMYYHAAHDIGHALSDLKMVGCTSFSVRNSFSSDGKLLLGRNFDFYMGEEFAKDKLLLFVKPDKGIPFSSYSWAGFTGVVSGLNADGISVTLNASKSAVPLAAKEPISILAREILQYTKSISEATTLAENRSTFVSESILIGSAIDRNSAIIEKGPEKMDVYQSNDDFLYCSNHYQSDLFINDEVNIENVNLSDTQYRWDRVKELVVENQPLSFASAAAILRNKEGKGDKALGYGNARALNQLIAYHAVVFKPEDRLMWVSTYPYQLGKFLCYNLDSVFAENNKTAAIDSLEIANDDFMYSNDFKLFKEYRIDKERLVKHNLMGRELNLSEREIEHFIATNPNSYEVYVLLGKYFLTKNEICEALEMFERSLGKLFASKKERLEVEELINDCKTKCKS